MFEDRKDAGKRLGLALKKYKNKAALVLAIPKGGAQVGYEVAIHLNAEFSILIARKLPFPDNPESGFGAIAENGSTFIFEQAKRWLSEELIGKILQEQKKEIKRRIKILRQNRPLPNITNKTVILVDDGLAMGSTMQAAITLCKNKKARKIIVAVPVSGKDVAERIQRLVDEIVVLEKPLNFVAVAQAYKNWYDVSDQEVIRIVSTGMLITIA